MDVGLTRCTALGHAVQAAVIKKPTVIQLIQVALVVLVAFIIVIVILLVQKSVLVALYIAV